MRKNAKNSEKVRKKLPTRRGIKRSTPSAYPPQEGAKPFQQESNGGASDQQSNTQGEGGPPRIETLRGASRDSAGVLT